MLDWITVMESISYRAVEGTQRFSGYRRFSGVEQAHPGAREVYSAP